MAQEPNPGPPSPPTFLTAPSARRPRPGWAWPALAIGIASSLVVAWIEADNAAALARGEPPSLSFVYALRMVPFLLAGLPLLLAGAVGVLRPWTDGRPWLVWVAVGGGLAWYAIAIGHGVPLPA
jgi:hypothetical protein